MSEQGKALATTQDKVPTLTAGGKVAAIVPKDQDEAWRLSAAICRAGMVPKSYEGRTPQETQSKVMIGIMKGLEVGFAPQAALGNIMIVNNRPSIWGDGALALVQNSDKYEWHKEWHEGTPLQGDWTAYCEFKRKDNPEPIKRSFSYQDAIDAKLNRKPGPWMSYPKRMLQMRARAFAIRDGFADILCGLSIAEEQHDVPQPAASADTSSLDDDFIDDTTGEGAVIDLELEEDDSGVIDAEEVTETNSEAEICQRCNGRGLLEWTDGESSGIEPCPDCTAEDTDAPLPVHTGASPESATA